jgi:hypothetical protein
MKAMTIRYRNIFLLGLIFFVHEGGAQSRPQSKFSLSPGIYYNGNGFSDDVVGMGLTVGLEYKPVRYFGLELRTRYGLYGFDDGTSWTTDWHGEDIPPVNEGLADLEHSLSSPGIGLIPKFYLSIGDDEDDPWFLFLENELSLAWIRGTVQYNGEPSARKRITETIFCYNIALGIEYVYNVRKNNNSIAVSAGYSTLNFRKKIRKNQPEGYIGWIPDQDAALILNIILKIPPGKP